MFLFVAVIGFVAQAQEKKAEIKFVAEEIDYGVIKQGDNGLRVFEFKNTGLAPLVITSASSSCGCTVPSWPKEPIAPGKTGRIEVKYDTYRIGAIRKTITIVSNAADNPTVALRIKGTVEPKNTATMSAKK